MGAFGNLWARLHGRYSYRVPMALASTILLLAATAAWSAASYEKSDEDMTLVTGDGAFADDGASDAPEESLQPPPADGAPADVVAPDAGPAITAAPTTGASRQPGGARQPQRNAGGPTTAQPRRTQPSPQAQGAANACPQGLDRGDCTGVTDKEIRLGSHAATSQCGTPLPDTSDENEAEASDWIEYINKVQGGVHGRQLRLFEADDGYCPELAGRAARQLMDENRVFSAQGFLGVDQNKVVADYAQKRGVPYLAGGGPREWASRWSVFHQNQSSYDVMYPAILRFIISPQGLNKPNARIGMMYVETDDVKEPTFRAFAAVPNANVVVKLPLQGIKQNFSNEISQMVAADVDTVYCNCHPLNMVAFVSQADAANFRPQYTFVSQGYDLDLVLRLFSPTSTWTQNVKGLSNFCHPSHGCSAPYVQKLKQVKPNVKVSQVALVGIHAIEMWAEPMRRVGPQLSRGRYMQALGSLEGWTTGLTGGVDLAPDRSRGTVEFAVYESPGANSREYRMTDRNGRGFNQW